MLEFGQRINVSIAEGVVDLGDGGAELGAVHAEVEVDRVEGEAEVTGRGDEVGGLSLVWG